MYRIVISTYNFTFCKELKSFPKRENIVSALLGLADAAYTDLYKGNLLEIKIDFKRKEFNLIDNEKEGDQFNMQHYWEIVEKGKKVPVLAPILNSIRKQFQMLPLKAYFTHSAPLFRMIAKADLNSDFICAKSNDS